MKNYAKLLRFASKIISALKQTLNCISIITGLAEQMARAVWADNLSLADDSIIVECYYGVIEQKELDMR